MTRPSLDSVLIDIARVVARRSTCSRLNVGAVLARDTRVISTGYNGAMSGAVHCVHECDCVFGDTGHWPGCASQKPCATAVHAEANALAFAARYGVATDGASLYVTHAPCALCARLLVNAGVVSVTFAEHYRSTEGLGVLLLAGIKVNEGGM